MMDQDFWLARWEDQQIGFHQPDGHPLLSAYWPDLDLAPRTPVLVPLCGKSRDMIWLAQQGHPVTGIELSARAARDFFSEAQLTPTIAPHGRFERHAAGGIEILVGDFFDLQPEHLAAYGAFFDRAALIALPEAMRARYVETLTAAMSARGTGLLVTIDYPCGAMNGPPFAVTDAEVRRLFGPRCMLARLTERDTAIGHSDGSEPTPACETLYRITRR